MAVSYLCVISCCRASYGAHPPDVPGCIAASADLNQVKELIKDGLALHLEGILEDGDEVPPARTTHLSGKDLQDVVEQVVVSIKVPVPHAVPVAIMLLSGIPQHCNNNGRHCFHCGAPAAPAC